MRNPRTWIFYSRLCLSLNKFADSVSYVHLIAILCQDLQNLQDFAYVSINLRTLPTPSYGSSQRENQNGRSVKNNCIGTAQ